MAKGCRFWQKGRRRWAHLSLIEMFWNETQDPCSAEWLGGASRTQHGARGWCSIGASARRPSWGPESCCVHVARTERLSLYSSPFGEKCALQINEKVTGRLTK